MKANNGNKGLVRRNFSEGGSLGEGGPVRRHVRRNFSEGGSPALRDEGGPSPRRSGYDHAGGFTLIELMTVLAIIVVLAGLIVGGAKYAGTKAARSRAEAEIAAMENALENYKTDNGAYPNCDSSTRSGAISDAQNNSIKLYAALAGGTKVYMTFKPNQLRGSSVNTYIVDPFGSPYNYYYNPNVIPSDQMNPVTFDLW